MKTAAGPEIRPATPADLEALAILEKRSFAKPWGRDALARELAKPTSIVLLLKTDSSRPPEAYLCAQAIPPEAELLRLAVTPTARRRNLAQSLFEHLLAILQRRQATTLFLEVSENNHPARAFYEKQGFVQVGLRPAYYDVGQTPALLLSREIPGQSFFY